MDCPKCGAPQVTGSEVCPSCGVIFSKLRRVTMDQPLPDTNRPASEYPPWMVYAFLGFFLLLGAVWVKHKRSHHVEVNPDDQLNAINHSIVIAEKAHAQAELDRTYRGVKTQYPFRTLPDGWDEQTMIDDINKCSGLTPMRADRLGEIRGDDKTLVVFFTTASTDSAFASGEGSAVYIRNDFKWHRDATAVETDGHVRYLSCN